MRDPFSIYVERAVVRFELGQYEGALSDCNAELRLNPNSCEAYGARSMTHQKLGNDAASQADRNRAIELKDLQKR